MSYPYEVNLADLIAAFPLERIRDVYRRNEEAELAQLKEWFAGLTAEEQEQRKEWKPREGLAAARLHPSFQDVVGPYEMAVVEQVRSELALMPTNEGAVPADAFIWALGEPEIRHATKVGGLPYRPSDAPWPMIAADNQSNPRWRKAAGQPMTFLAQFCFTGSRDLFPHLPGDVLLIFVEDEQFSRPQAVYTEWQPLGLSSLVPADAVPAPSFEFVTAFGYRHRTADFGRYEYCEYDLGSAGEHARNLGATKIGGLPHYIQSEGEEAEAHSGREMFLAQLSSLITTDCHHYPWLNHREPWTDPTAPKRCLNLVDGGLVYLFLKPGGEVTWGFQCS